jgi:two-component system, chemotaxis family, CheB/CheR fusion protein
VERRVPDDVVAEEDCLSQPMLPFAVVGIGASAGGLDAVKDLLRALRPDTGMAFVFISHLSPHHDSALAAILARVTSLPVIEVNDEPEVKPNQVYVIPPARMMTLAEGRLSLDKRDTTRSSNRAVDIFFQSLAAGQGAKSIGVVLSGSASDGTLGLEEIKAAGGITFAQDESAQYDSMPRTRSPAGLSISFCHLLESPTSWDE